MTATVYHADYDRRNRDLAFEISFDPNPTYVEAQILGGSLRYKRVAVLKDCNDREQAWELTNTIEHPWYTNLGVERCFEGPNCRSTSVGDVIDENGTFYLVVSVGMVKLDFNIRQHYEVFEALFNAHENGYPLDPNDIVAVDLVDNCQPLEKDNSFELHGHIQSWRHWRLGQDLNKMVKEATK